MRDAAAAAPRAEALIEGLHAGQVLGALLLVLAFALPGVLAIARWDAERRFTWPARAALGFVAGFGAFSALTGPLLLAHQPARWAWLASLSAWTIASLAALAWPRRRAAAEAVPLEPDLRELAAPEPHAALALAALGLASLAGAVALAAKLVPRRLALLLLVGVFLANGWLLLRSRRLGAPEESPRTSAQLRPLRRAAAWGAAALLAFALVATTLYVREDSDDTLYLSQALVLADSPAMAAELPVHRGEGLPSNLLYDWQAFELWGSLLARASGVHPMVLFRTLFAPLALLLAAALGYELLRRVLPRSSLGVASLVALAYTVFGVSSHWTANNYLMPRPAQGKTWLVHVAVPALVLLTVELMRRPRHTTWLLLLAGCFAALGFAPTAVYLVASALGALVLAHLALWPTRATLLRGAAVGASLLPLVWFGLYLFTHVDGNVAEAIADRVTPARWRDDFLFGHLDFQQGKGGLELFPLVALPLAALFAPRREQLVYPVAFTLLLFATVLSPLTHGLVGGPLTGWEGYKRLFWLVPYPFLLGVLAAGGVRAAAAARRPALAAAGVLAAFLVALPLAGGSFVFGPGNPSGGSSPAPYRARNAYKMPEDLRLLAEVLLRGRHGPDARVLCSDRTASHLAPLARELGFVYTRTYLTRASLLFAGRAEEAAGRERLARAFLRGELAQPEALALLAEHRTAWVVQELDSAPVEDALRAAGFAEAGRFGVYRLWERAAH